MVSERKAPLNKQTKKNHAIKLFGEKIFFPGSVCSGSVIAVCVPKRTYPCWDSQAVTGAGAYFQGDLSTMQPLLFFFFLLDPIGFGLHSVFVESHLPWHVWLVPAPCSSGRGCPRRPLTPAPKALQPPALTPLCWLETLLLWQALGQMVRLAMEDGNSLRTEEF